MILETELLCRDKAIPDLLGGDIRVISVPESVDQFTMSELCKHTMGSGARFIFIERWNLRSSQYLLRGMLRRADFCKVDLKTLAPVVLKVCYQLD